MKFVALFIAAVTIVSCSNKDKDPAFCKCLEVSEELNSEASKYMSVDLDKTTDEDLEKLRELTEKKDKHCADFEMLGGEELIKKKEACK